MKSIAVKTILFLMLCSLMFSCSPTPPPPTPAHSAAVPTQTPLPTQALPTVTPTEIPIPTEMEETPLLRITIDGAHSIRIDGYLTEPGQKTVYITAERPDLSREVAWAPDGKQFVYANQKSGLYIYSLETETLEAIQLTLDPRDGEINGSVDWSPDGEWIAFGRDRNGGFREPGTSIYLVHPDGTGYHAIFTSPANKEVNMAAIVASWTSDSKYILFSLQVDHRREAIHIVDVEGKYPQRLTPYSPIDRFLRVAVSPDGKTIYYPTREGIRMSPIDCYYDHSCTEIPSEPADLFPITWYKDHTPRWTGDYPTFYEKYGLP